MYQNIHIPQDEAYHAKHQSIVVQSPVMTKEMNIILEREDF